MKVCIKFNSKNLKGAIKIKYHGKKLTIPIHQKEWERHEEEGELNAWIYNKLSKKFNMAEIEKISDVFLDALIDP